MTNKYNNYSKKLSLLKNNFQFRSIKNIESKTNKYLYSEGRKYLNLSSNNYLGLADNIEFIDKFNNEVISSSKSSFGSASARLLTGNLPVYQELEDNISKLYAKDKTLIFNSGYHANIGILSAFVGKKDVVFSDKLNHASIIDGMKLSGGDFYRYKHLDYQNLENLLEKHRENYENAVIITESIFSMDGDIADIKKLVELKNKYNAILVVDEAHSFGIYGDNALGICEEQGVVENIDIIVGTFGKAIASIGAFVAGSEILIDYLINNARSFIFSTAIPPICVAWSNWIINKILPNTSDDRCELLKTSNEFRNLLSEYKLETFGHSHIIPIVLGDNEKTSLVCEKLQGEGFWVLPIRPPTVPVNTSRLRISLTTKIMMKDIESMPKIISEVLR